MTPDRCSIWAVGNRKLIQHGASRQAEQETLRLENPDTDLDISRDYCLITEHKQPSMRGSDGCDLKGLLCV